MNIRPDIAALIAAGHTDTGIAARLGIDRTTANRTRRALRLRSQRAAEAKAAPKHRPWTPEEQAAHRDELLAALTGTTDHRPRRRHLRAVPPAA